LVPNHSGGRGEKIGDQVFKVHLDGGASQFLSKQFLVDAVGYFYEQVSLDSKAGYIFPLGSVQAYVNLKAYWEFDGHGRASGWNTWRTLSLRKALRPIQRLR
jgi:hypothetical protein